MRDRLIGGLKRVWDWAERVPVLGWAFTVIRFALRRDMRGLRAAVKSRLRRNYNFFKRVYGWLERLPVVGGLLRWARQNHAGLLRSLVRRAVRGELRRSVAPYLEHPRLVRWRLQRRARLASRNKVTPTGRRQLGRTGFLYTYEFDAAAGRYSDIKSMIVHNERAKPLVSPFYRALYDLRSGLILRMAWIMEEVLQHHAGSFGLAAAGFAPLQLLRSSYADLDPRSQSIAYLQSALREDPALAEAHYHLGIIYRETGRLEEALSCYRAALDLPPVIRRGQHDIPLNARSLYESGLVLQKLGRHDEARGNLQKAVQILPGFGDAHREFAHELRRAGAYADAAEQYYWAMYYRPGLAVLPRLPARLEAAKDSAVFHEPDIVDPFAGSPVPLPPLTVHYYRYFRIFELFGRHYGIPTVDGDIDYHGILAREHSVMFDGQTHDSIVASINTYWDS